MKPGFWSQRISLPHRSPKTTESLGLPKYLYDYIVEAIQRPNGIFIATGPTSCGKTTTLYSCLRRVNTIDSKLLTAEDPVEYDIEGLNLLFMRPQVLDATRVLRAEKKFDSLAELRAQIARDILEAQMRF